MSGRIYAILDENGARVENGLSEAAHVDVGSAGIHEHDHGHSEFELRRLIVDAFSESVKNIPDHVEYVQRRSFHLYGNKHTWFVGIVGLFVSVLLLYFVVKRARARWMRAQMIREAQTKHRKKVKKSG